MMKKRARGLPPPRRRRQRRRGSGGGDKTMALDSASSLPSLLLLAAAAAAAGFLFSVCSSLSQDGSGLDRVMPQPQRDACREQQKRAGKRARERWVRMGVRTEPKVFFFLLRSRARFRIEKKDNKKLGKREKARPLFYHSLSAPHILITLFAFSLSLSVVSVRTHRPLYAPPA